MGARAADLIQGGREGGVEGVCMMGMQTPEFFDN